MIRDVMSKPLCEGDPQSIRRQHKRPMLAKRHIHRLDKAMRCGSPRQNDFRGLSMATDQARAYQSLA